MKNKTGLRYENKVTNILGFILLLMLYGAAYFGLNYISRSNATIDIFGAVMPAQVLTGVFSSLANIFTILFVIFYKKVGFITAIVITVVQFPVLIFKFFTQQHVQSLPGIFSTIFTLTAIILIYSRNRKIEKYQDTEIRNLKEQQKISERLFKQTATALVNAIDAKDTYSHGHSIRVADYSLQIAKLMGKNEEDCNKVFYAALLHDVGKILIDDSIINKRTKLTEEEYAVVKQHPVTGNQILASISEYPYLSIGAHFHHERYDGKGYPIGLKGSDIPEIARIISVADAYDAMSSNRSYRDAIPQQLVREEIVKGTGTQFDPDFAKIMLGLIDDDPDYEMREKRSVSELDGLDELVIHEHRNPVSDGILITAKPTKIRIKLLTGKNPENGTPGYASLLVFDSLDGRYHNEDSTVIDLNYYEYAELFFSGKLTADGVRRSVVSKFPSIPREPGSEGILEAGEAVYDIFAVKQKDHMLVRIDDGKENKEITLALPDSSRYVYIGLTGANCEYEDVDVEVQDHEVDDKYITRIAEEISYIDGPEGDVPNLQVDGHRTSAAEGILITNEMKISFHTMSLPTARLIWHCPYFSIFSSADKKVFGKNFTEYALLRLDGENLESDIKGVNDTTVKNEKFPGWDEWKKALKEGIDCEISVKREGNRVITSFDTLGLNVKNITEVPANTDIYFGLTGDQVALTNIQINKKV